MRKIALIFLSIFLFIIWTSPVLAGEVEYYGIGADIKKIDRTTFQIKTNGKQPNEGFGISSIDVTGNQNISFQSNFKGKGEIIVKIAQFDESGKLLKESTSKPIILSSTWDRKQADTKLVPKSKHIQILFLTSEAENQIFYLKNIRIQTKDQPSL
ncbi:hypothetical protein [Salirhabdus sp. Marseille-P4669]|uniref:hypothetical protein n=1 Tax=Salirhabdus sp. Marseille-P4669 TaxID=2042310 RepID=UPI000C7CC7C8|nr:hypothetical protein [Salirhabdus sp. Marseille-P4669]